MERLITEWQITPLDTLFFRGPEPFTAGESVFLRSLFPPTPQTLQGMARSILLETHCVDLAAFSANRCPRCVAFSRCAVRDVVGTPAGGIGSLDLRGPYLIHTGAGGLSRLYPAPADLRVGERRQVFRLAPGRPVHCDAGYLHLPERPGAPDGGAGDGATPAWITEEGLLEYGQGAVPAESRFADPDQLWSFEGRVGLGRDPVTRGARAHMLYSIEIVRLREGISLGLRIHGASDDPRPDALGVQRLGGEGRLVEVREQVVDETRPDSPEVASAVDRSCRFRLILLAPADFDGDWHPPTFEQATADDDTTCWRGTLNGIRLRILGSCGRAIVPIGGWSIADNRPKAVRWCVPAGTVYYCLLDGDDDANAVLNALDNQKLGKEAKAGFGWAVVGAWLEPFEGGGLT